MVALFMRGRACQREDNTIECNQARPERASSAIHRNDGPLGPDRQIASH